LPAEQAPRRRARGVILVLLEGGMSHLDTWDPKPQAPAEIRGEFQSIATRVPGLRIAELMPRLAQQAHLYNLIRSMHCDARNDHSPGMHLLLTGWENVRAGVGMQTVNAGYPSQGSVIAHQLGAAGPGGVPRFVALPGQRQIDGRVAYTGPAFLGASCEAFTTGSAPDSARQAMQVPPALALAKDVPWRRLQDREVLRKSFDRLNKTLDGNALLGRMDAHYQRALETLGGERMRKAFDLHSEPAALRERYGNHRVGQSLLLARRLVEAGATYVLVDPYGGMVWDTHSNNFPTLKNLLPPLDQAVSALLSDLDQRGELDETLVLLTTEMGRTPKIGVRVTEAGSGSGGRDHWTHVYSLMLAGGGLTRGQVLGSSTRHGERPGNRPVSVPEVLATIYQQLGIDPNTMLADEQKRPIPLLPDGAKAVPELIA
jgi:hypothetical protein